MAGGSLLKCLPFTAFVEPGLAARFAGVDRGASEIS